MHSEKRHHHSEKYKTTHKNCNIIPMVRPSYRTISPKSTYRIKYEIPCNPMKAEYLHMSQNDYPIKHGSHNQKHNPLLYVYSHTYFPTCNKQNSNIEQCPQKPQSGVRTYNSMYHKSQKRAINIIKNNVHTIFQKYIAEKRYKQLYRSFFHHVPFNSFITHISTYKHKQWHMERINRPITKISIRIIILKHMSKHHKQNGKTFQTIYIRQSGFKGWKFCHEITIPI